MRQSLPRGNFEWLTQEGIRQLDITTVSDESPTGLEKNLEIDPKHHNFFNNCLFCPEAIITPGAKQRKQIPNLNNKTKYIIHYQN